MENSSQVGVLSIMRSHQKASGLISPVEVHRVKKKSGNIQLDSFITQLKSDFAPVRPLKLYVPYERKSLEKTIKDFGDELQKKQESLRHSSETKVVCSSRPELILGTIKENTNAEAIKAVEEAEVALLNSFWSKQSLALYRVSILLKAADLMLLRRNKLATLMIYEAGKTMTEALAD
jgi:RHH-type proline utilization regulon transcriptional repressor/proline dehydrogenase/delta 1-pyrroline-5-carboxylate dehydrogenase